MLLDTHVLLWMLDDSPRLGAGARRWLAEAPAPQVSAASLWELAIKSERGKVSVPDDLPARVDAAGLTVLPVSGLHAWQSRTIRGLPHRDPFDRLLVAQARAQDLTLLTADRALLSADLDPQVRRLDARR